jgi:hypothetical protein
MIILVLTMAGLIYGIIIMCWDIYIMAERYELLLFEEKINVYGIKCHQKYLISQ